jgi:hypothetical protein
MSINYTLPLWSVIMTIAIFLMPIVWGLIKMHFKQIEMRKDILRQDQEMTLMNKEMTFIKESVMIIKKDIEDKLDRHKTSNDSKLMDINNISVKTMTLVELLVQDKIKK